MWPWRDSVQRWREVINGRCSPVRVDVWVLPGASRRVASRQHRSASRRQHWWSCRATGSAPTAEGHLPWPVRRCGTLCLTIWEIRPVAVMASDARWKRFCLRRTETCSAFGVLRECAIQIYFYLLTYLLTLAFVLVPELAFRTYLFPPTTEPTKLCYRERVA